MYMYMLQFYSGYGEAGWGGGVLDPWLGLCSTLV